MSASAPLRVRRSISDLQVEYDKGNTAPLENLMRAWKGMKELPHHDPRSFFNLGGYHGEPFRGPGETDPAWWGGYCQHGTVLFPSWHRAYLFTLEESLRSIEGCEDVTLPFWDECSDASQNAGIPKALTDETFTLDGVVIPNPLRSFVLPVGITDQVKGDNALYSKHAGYETVRYPLSGLVGTDADRATTAAHNARFPSYKANVATLNGNIIAWLTSTVMIEGKPFGEIHAKFAQCLDAPTYTLFSNTTSQRAWNDAHPTDLVVALEAPHNSMHLAVGGFEVPGYDASPIDGANGDMGENDTAGLDPIFYFHHCFIDYVFWTWQQRNGATDTLSIDASDPGAVYVLGGNNQPPAGADPDAPITLDTPLDPFLKADSTPFTTRDCINIETQLGYAYGPASLDSYATRTGGFMALAAPDPTARTVHIEGLDRTKIRGSFLISAYATIDGERKLVGREAVLSRWHVGGCANCQNHLKVSADFRVAGLATEEPAVQIEVLTRQGLLGGPPRALAGGLATADSLVQTKPAFSVEVR